MPDASIVLPIIICAQVGVGLGLGLALIQTPAQTLSLALTLALTICAQMSGMPLGPLLEG